MKGFAQFRKKIDRMKGLGLINSTHMLFDKIRRRLNMVPRVPPTVYIELTDICNLDCSMCDRGGMTRESGMMDMALFRMIVDNAVEIGVPALKLNRFGESLLHPHLIEMIRYCKKRGVHWVYFTSNGTLLTEEKSRELILSGLDSITFSFDGATKETYERIRGRAKYEEVKKNIMTFLELRKRLGKGSPRVVINTILSRDTKDEIYDVFRLWGPHVDRINVLPVGRYGNVEDLSPLEREDRPSKRRPCHQIFDRLMIFWDGKVTVCCADINGELSVGHIRESRIEELWKNEAFSGIRRKHLMLDFSGIPICTNCDSTDALYFREMYRQRKLVYKKAAGLGLGR